MTTILTVVHIAVCLFLVIIVLLQHGKGADAGAAFGGGGGSSQSLLGTEGAVPLLNKITTFSAIVFMVTSVSLAYISSSSSTGSVMSSAVTTPATNTEQVIPDDPKVIPMPTEATEEAAPPAPEAAEAKE